ncbi:ABC transporter permease [Schleiferilactobacillus shenzhenensis]|nr:ABC transporter permease [Schleiferilactobacillus shenzhenensis]
MLFPLARWLLPGTPFFFERLTAGHFVIGFLFLWVSALPGMAVANVFNRHAVANRYLAVLLTILVLVCGYITPTVAADHAWWRTVSWLLPPFGDSLNILNHFAALMNGQAVLSILIQLAYTVALAALAYVWQQYRKMA